MFFFAGRALDVCFVVRGASCVSFTVGRRTGQVRTTRTDRVRKACIKNPVLTLDRPCVIYSEAINTDRYSKMI